MEDRNLSRRKFIGLSAVTAVGATLASQTKLWGMPAYIPGLGKPDSLVNGVQIGVISYSFRSITHDAEKILQFCRECNISGIELMGDAAEIFAGAPLPPATPRWGAGADSAAWNDYARRLAPWRAEVGMQRFKQLRQLYRHAGVKIYAYKPSALGVNNTDAEIHYACMAARALGADHVTVEFPEEPAHTHKLAAIAAKYRIRVGYHGHLQQTPRLWDEACMQSKFNAINLDLGHYVAAGYDPLAFIQQKNQDIVSMHIKDRKSKANGGGNMPWGEGDTPLAAALQLMARNQYKFPATIELEYPVPAGSTIVKEIARCADFARRALQG